LRGVPRLIGHIEAESTSGLPDCTVAEVMSGEPLTCSPNDAIDVIARRIQDLRIGCLPVVSDGVLIGVITVTDLLRGFTEHLQGPDLHKVSLICAQSRAHRPPDITAIAAQLGIELAALLSGVSDAGARMHLVRTRTTEERHLEFISACQAAGMLVVGERSAA
jgi:acetoin utilization protein AcuB